MKSIIPSSSTEATAEPIATQPRPFVLAVVLTAILYFSVGSTLPRTTGPFSRTSPVSASVSASVANAVLRDVSERAQMPASALRIVHAEPHTWGNECLELQEHRADCTKGVSGWQVIVAGGPRRWVYRTDATGSLVKLHQGTVMPVFTEIVSELPSSPRQ
ncbi:hypothetical protein [Microcoleus sp. FACHB-68]|uniref:hypothetical protein n=1 Tax=Microcoleus sp. FACHB-68 TaxID=2692826 RepID=UPI001688A4AD|nr:hypothetical protein [Microcoleus sp. FACHB-68]MBD1937233.1 hypothetical protein [Microcoleus sp. FACHB-68]